MKVKTVSRALCVALFALACATARAQDLPSPAPSASPSSYPQIVRVTTSDRADETLANTPRTTYVVTHDDIIRHGYLNVADALAGVPGVTAFSYGPIGSLASPGIRGASSASTLVLVDGLPAPGAAGNTVDLGNFSTSGVQRIEIVEGGGTTLYGSGSVGGVINVITQSSKASPFADVRVGSFGETAARVELPGFAFERIVAGNAYPLPSNAVLGDRRANADYEASAVHAAFGRQLGAITVDARANLAGDRLGTPGSSDSMAYTPFDRENDVNADVRLRLTKTATQSRATLELGGAHQLIGYDCTDSGCAYAFTYTDSEGRVDASLRDVVDSARSTLLYGMDLARAVVRSDNGPGAVGTNALSQSAAYIQQTWHWQSGARIYAGLRAERDASLGGQYSPSLGFTAPIRNGIALRGNLADAFRAPNASELYFPGYGNPNLQAERSRVGDLTLTDARMLGGASVGWFFQFARNLIVAPAPTYAPVNQDRAAVAGFTGTLRTRRLNGFWLAVDVTDLYRAQGYDPTSTVSRLPNDPVVNAWLEVNYRGNGRIEDAGITTRTVGARAAFSSYLPAYDQAVPFTRADAFVRFRLAPQALLTVRALNFGNERYAEIAGYPMPGRAFSVELSNR